MSKSADKLGKTKMKNYTVKMTEDLKKQLDDEATTAGIDTSDVVRMKLKRKFVLGGL